MTLRHIKIFVEVCKHNSITKAAEALYLAQPSVSMAIKELECHYNSLFFDRISRKLYITDAGRIFLNYARTIVQMMEESERELQGEKNRSRIRIGASITIATCYMPQIVTIFKESNPDIKVNMFVNNSGNIEDAILRNEVDFAVVEGVPASDSLVKENFFRSSMKFICSSAHHFSLERKIEISSLLKENILLREKGSGARQIVDSVFFTKDIVLEPYWESSSTTALINATIANIGVSILPYELVKFSRGRGALRFFQVKSLSIARKFCLAYHKNKILTPPMRSFMDMCKKHFEGIHDS